MQGCRDACRDAGMQWMQCWDAGIGMQGCSRDACRDMHVYMDTWDAWTHAHGHMDTWTHGHMWTHCHMPPCRDAGDVGLGCMGCRDAWDAGSDAGMQGHSGMQECRDAGMQGGREAGRP